MRQRSAGCSILVDPGGAVTWVAKPVKDLKVGWQLHMHDWGHCHIWPWKIVDGWTNGEVGLYELRRTRNAAVLACTAECMGRNGLLDPHGCFAVPAEQRWAPLKWGRTDNNLGRKHKTAYFWRPFNNAPSVNDNSGAGVLGQQWHAASINLSNMMISQA